MPDGTAKCAGSEGLVKGNYTSFVSLAQDDMTALLADLLKAEALKDTNRHFCQRCEATQACAGTSKVVKMGWDGEC